ncbi:MAG: acyltransferase [Geobacteraceae bacterium]|nr:acyltransferase [Geobacteraceae bacterium]
MNLLAGLVSYIFTDRIIRFFSKFYKKVRWNGMKRRFAAVGKGSFIEAPWIITNPQNITVGENFLALSTLRIETFEEYLGERFTPQIIIGDNVAFNNDCHIGCINRIEIGNNVLGASRIYITDHYHGRIEPEDLEHVPTKRRLYSKGPVIIGDNVWIGENVTVLPGVTIGENAIIGANTVVNKNIPANAVAAGVPARIVRLLVD